MFFFPLTSFLGVDALSNRTQSERTFTCSVNFGTPDSIVWSRNYVIEGTMISEREQIRVEEDPRFSAPSLQLNIMNISGVYEGKYYCQPFIGGVAQVLQPLGCIIVLGKK